MLYAGKLWTIVPVTFLIASNMLPLPGSVVGSPHASLSYGQLKHRYTRTLIIPAILSFILHSGRGYRKDR